jgi:hypothetical protein
VAGALGASCGVERAAERDARSSHSALVRDASGSYVGTSECFDRTELYFGLTKAGGGIVQEAEFQKFLDEVVTPRFADGFTLLAGYGQFRREDGAIDKEASKLLILLYSAQTTAASSVKIDEIRDTYRRLFDQRSVLRADRQCERVTF